MRKYLIVLLFAALVCLAADKPAPKEMSDTEATALREVIVNQRLAAAEVKSATAELKAAQIQQEMVNNSSAEFYTSLCAAHGITAPNFQALNGVCNVDLEKRTVTKKDPPPAK